MHVPNLVGDWQEYDEAFAGVRIRVYDLKRVDPPKYRHDDAKGLTYFGFSVTVENRAEEYFTIDLDRWGLDVRIGKNGESALVDESNSKLIRGFNVYPMHRATASILGAGLASKLKTMDIQVGLHIDGVQARRYVWAGGMGVHEQSTGRGLRPSTARTSIASEVTRFLEGESESR
ncbi:hypothetical protein [Kitasatospora sp. NPDC056731]|uniref:hypothetical protein n=1 Tax=Kitasatospora sp. NPDC056731 TaxID=3155422 RepID=UPI00341F2899